MRRIVTLVSALARAVVLLVLSPTFLAITVLKRRFPNSRTGLLTVWSWAISGLVLFLAVLLTIVPPTSDSGRAYAFIAIALLGWSRINEIVFAFIKDGADTLEKKPRLTTFTPMERIRFVAICYLELIIDFGFVYVGAQSLADILETGCAFKERIPNVSEAAYLSSMIMTTLGYADYVPTSGLTKALSIYEVLSGLILFVFALAAYSGAEHKRATRDRADEPTIASTGPPGRPEGGVGATNFNPTDGPP